jgi:FkbM family methyltransferase
VETARRLHSDNYFVVSDREKVTFYLPHKRDYIQQIIIVKKSFYELTYLRNIERYIDNKSVIIDIGSNIGNHAVYFGKIKNVKKMYLFEPNEDAFSVLKKNIQINGLNNITNLYDFALGSKNSKAEIDLDGSSLKNLGRTSIKESDKGDIEIKKLDNIEITEDTVDLIKIDVEGFEIEVIKGALETINRYKPVIWVEAFENNYEIVKELLESESYYLKEEMGDSNYIFVPM